MGDRVAALTIFGGYAEYIYLREIDYHTQDFVQVIRQADPDGLDAVFDGMVWGYLEQK